MSQHSIIIQYTDSFHFEVTSNFQWNPPEKAHCSTHFCGYCNHDTKIPFRFSERHRQLVCARVAGSHGTCIEQLSGRSSSTLSLVQGSPGHHQRDQDIRGGHVLHLLRILNLDVGVYQQTCAGCPRSHVPSAGRKRRGPRGKNSTSLQQYNFIAKWQKHQVNVHIYASHKTGTLRHNRTMGGNHTKVGPTHNPTHINKYAIFALKAT